MEGSGQVDRRVGILGPPSILIDLSKESFDDAARGLAASAVRVRHAPFLIGDIALVMQSGLTILLASGRGSHDGAKR
jgi:hypothetical protein